MVYVHTTLYLRVSEAKELLAKDFNGKSDPYCVIKVDNVVIARTDTVYKSLDPFWGEEFILHMPSGFQLLSFYIYDADKVSSGDDIIGTACVSRDYLCENKNPKGLESWLPLQKANKDLEIQGEMLLEYGIRTSYTTGLSYVFVTVVEGRDLAAKDKTGYSDPYVSVTCFDEVKLTSKQKKTRFPEWNETLEFQLPEDTCISDLSVIVTVWDKDNFSSDDFMGQIHLNSDDITQGVIRNWHAVARRPAKDNVFRRASRVERGKIRVKLQLLEETVLPPSSYIPLVGLLNQAVKQEGLLGPFLWNMLEQDHTIELGALAVSLVRFYLSQESIYEYNDAIVCRDIENTDDVNILFRGNSLATKSIDNFMKVLAMPYLQKVLQPIIDRIMLEKKMVELDPFKVNSVRSRRHSLHRESEESFVNHSMETLEDYLSNIMEAILASASSCPLVLRRVLRNIQNRVREKWTDPEHKDLPYIAVSGFVFLRFFAPAILSPKLFSLSDQHPNIKISRTLTLLAKVIQSIGNLTPGQHGKEVWLVPLSPIICQYIDRVKEFIDTLVQVTDNPGLPKSLCRQESNETVLIQGYLHKCHYHCKRLFRPIVLKKCYFYLTRVLLCYRKTPEHSEDTLVMVDNICAVEKLDYGALGKSNMGQILHKTSDENIAIIYFQAKDVNELTAWISAIRKTCKYNNCRTETFHPGVFKGDKWNCCRKEQDTAPGCSPTYHGVVLGDWQDPLDPDLDAQIIYSQLANVKDKMKKTQHELRKSMSVEPDSPTNEKDGDNGIMNELEMVSSVLDVTEQIAMSHQTFSESFSNYPNSSRHRGSVSSVSSATSRHRGSISIPLSNRPRSISDSGEEP